MKSFWVIAFQLSARKTFQTWLLLLSMQRETVKTFLNRCCFLRNQGQWNSLANVFLNTFSLCATQATWRKLSEFKFVTTCSRSIGADKKAHLIDTERKMSHFRYVVRENKNMEFSIRFRATEEENPSTTTKLKLVLLATVSAKFTRRTNTRPMKSYDSYIHQQAFLVEASFLLETKITTQSESLLRCRWFVCKRIIFERLAFGREISCLLPKTSTAKRWRKNRF